MISQAHVLDGYKLGHSGQYIEGTNIVYSNMTPRDAKLAHALKDSFDDKVDYCGLQVALKIMEQKWKDTFFSQPKEDVISKYTRRIKSYLGGDSGTLQIELMGKLHDLGYLPVEIKSLPEGSRVDMKVPVFTVKNTNPDFYWLTNYLETYLSCMVWPMCNAASLTRQYTVTSKYFAELTCTDDFWINIANHCFAARGHRGQEDAMLSGMAHLFYGVGSDTLWAVDGLEEYYNADCEKEMIAVSVNAFEHATTSQRISYFRNQKGFNEYPLQAEEESVRDIATNLYPKGICSYVQDTEDYFGFLEKSLPKLKEVILGRQEDSNGMCKWVIRPDSSPKTPLEVILGDPEAPEGSAEYKGSLVLLEETFGTTINSKGFKVLHSKVGLLYGEAISIELHKEIYQCMVDKGWCVSNILFGIGSWGFLDRSSRDSFGFAMKGSHSEVKGEEVPMQKNPKTASSFKKSAKGLLRVGKEYGKFVLYDQQTKEQEQQGLLETVFLDGKLVKETSLSEIRKLVKESL